MSSKNSALAVIARKSKTLRLILKTRILIFLLDLGGKVAPPILVALLWRVAFYRVRGVRCNKRSRTKLLILDKSIGTLDMIATYAAPADYDVQFISRSMIKIVAKHYLKGVVGDHDYKVDDAAVAQLKEEYRTQLNKVFHWLKRLFDVRVVVSFNPTYYAERELASACEEGGVRLVIFHKESSANKNVWKEGAEIFRSEVRSFAGSCILPYNNYVRDAYVDSGIVNSDRVIVTGCPRLDFAHNLRGNLAHDGEKYVLYYLSHPLAGLGLLGKKGGRFHAMKMSSDYEGIWMENILQIDTAFAELVTENPDINFVIKGKIGFFREQESHVKQNINLEQMKNLKCISGGSGERLLQNAAVVIGFNSTSVYEAIAAGIPVITPRLKMKCNEHYDQFAHDVCGGTVCPSTVADFKSVVLESYAERRHYHELSDRQIEILSKDMGNPDGKSGARVKEVLDSLMN